MNWKRALLAFFFLPISLLTAQHPANTARDEFFRRQAAMRERARQFNDLAGQIHSLRDAQMLVNMAAAEFSNEIPPGWLTRSLRDRIARAEFESASDPRALIPEDRVAAAWDDYLEKIGAPKESLVNAAEIHAVRDGLYVGGRMTWKQYPTILYTPNLYAAGPDKELAGGCRALEAIRVLWELDMEPDNLTAARGRIKLGITYSQLVKNASKAVAGGRQKSYAVVEIRQMKNLVWDAELKYIQDRGLVAINAAILQLLGDLFPN